MRTCIKHLKSSTTVVHVSGVCVCVCSSPGVCELVTQVLRSSDNRSVKGATPAACSQLLLHTMKVVQVRTLADIVIHSLLLISNITEL